MSQQTALQDNSPTKSEQSTLLKQRVASPHKDARPEGLAALQQRYGRLGLSLSPEAASSSISASVTGDCQLPALTCFQLLGIASAEGTVLAVRLSLGETAADMSAPCLQYCRCLSPSEAQERLVKYRLKLSALTHACSNDDDI